jgi:hypothetical protein
VTTTPDLPLTISVDGNLQAVDFIKRLHRGGLQLRRADDNGFAVIVLSDKDAGQDMRNRLFEAQGVVAAVRCALTSGSKTDEDSLQDALAAAERIIDNVCAALEGTP